MQKPVVEPPQDQHRLQPGGCGPDSSARLGEVHSGDSEAGCVGRWGGHGEGLRRTHGDAAGEKLGASPVDRFAVNVGTVLVLPSPPLGWRAGPSSAVDTGTGRSPRSSPSVGEPRTWRRRTARPRKRSVWQEPTVNTADPRRASARRGYCEAERWSTVSTGSGGEPGAVRVARRVRRAGRENGPGESPVLRPGSTQLRPVLPGRRRTTRRARHRRRPCHGVPVGATVHAAVCRALLH